MNNTYSRTKNVVLNVIAGLGGQFLVIVLRFVTRTVFIYTLGKSYLGINGLFSDILSMLSLTELGLDTAINFRLYKPLAEQDKHRVRVLLKFYKQAYRVIGGVILLVGFCMIPLLPKLIRDYESLAALEINAVLIFTLFLLKSAASYFFFAYRSAVMKANQKKYILDIADYAITIAANVIEILILFYYQNFMLYTAASVGFVIIQNLVNATISKHYYPEFFIEEPDSLSKDEIVDLFKDCGALFVYKANSVVLKATDNIVLSKYIGLAIVGMYSNYLLLYVTIKAFLQQVYTAMKASVGNLFAASDIEKKYKFFQTMNFITFILYGTAAVGISICADELIHCWISEDYIIAQPFSILVGCELLFLGIRVHLGQIRDVSGVFKQMWFRPILGIIINVGVSIWLAQVCGIYGVIIGTIVATFLTNFLVDPNIIYRYSFKNCRPVSEYYKKSLLYFATLITVCAFDFWICDHVLVGHGWFSVIVHGLIVLATVPGCFILIFRKSEEYEYLLNLWKSVLKKLLHRRSNKLKNSI